jgi:hypothetical protein
MEQPLDIAVHREHPLVAVADMEEQHQAREEQREEHLQFILELMPLEDPEDPLAVEEQIQLTAVEEHREVPADQVAQEELLLSEQQHVLAQLRVVIVHVDLVQFTYLMLQGHMSHKYYGSLRKTFRSK